MGGWLPWLAAGNETHAARLETENQAGRAKYPFTRLVRRGDGWSLQIVREKVLTKSCAAFAWAYLWMSAGVLSTMNISRAGLNFPFANRRGLDPAGEAKRAITR